MGSYGSGYTGTESPISSFAGLEERGYVYSDLDLVFLPSPLYTSEGLSGDVVRKFDDEAIKQSVKNIVMTNHYERPFKPLMGCNVRNTLFENFDGWAKYELTKRIKEQLEKWEPRATVEEVIIEENPDYHELNIEIDFRIIPIRGASENVTVKIQVERVR